ncbi:MAG: hypothetical protein ACTSRR_02300 [Candidatus Heimdallarchaeaceae archaeon]
MSEKEVEVSEKVEDRKEVEVEEKLPKKEKEVKKERKSKSFLTKIKELIIKSSNYFFVTILYLKIIKPAFYGLKIGVNFLLVLGKNFLVIVVKFFYKLYIVMKKNMEELSFFVHRFERAPLNLQIWVTSVFVFLLVSIWIAFGGRVG